MTFFRDIAHDLVEKRLWPVAILLALALIAVPMVLKEDASSAPPPTSGPRALGDVAKAVSLVERERGALQLGAARNPFGLGGVANPGAPPSSDTAGGAAASSTAPDTASGDPAAGGGGGDGAVVGGTLPGGGTGTPTVPSTPPRGTMTWVLELSFGPADDQRRMTLLPGRALPSNSEPILIFLGTPDGGRSATFLVSSDAVPQGDGSCQPSRRACEQLTMRAGQTAFFDVASGTGSDQYQLDLSGIVRKRV